MARKRRRHLRVWVEGLASLPLARARPCPYAAHPIWAPLTRRRPLLTFSSPSPLWADGPTPRRLSTRLLLVLHAGELNHGDLRINLMAHRDSLPDTKLPLERSTDVRIPSSSARQSPVSVLTCTP